MVVKMKNEADEEEEGCLNGRMTESTDLKHAKRRLIGSKNAGEKMIGLEEEY